MCAAVCQYCFCKRNAACNLSVFLQTYYFTGERIEKQGPDRYLVCKGTFTSCEGGLPDWSFHTTTAAVTVDAKGPYAQAALDALEDVWGRRAVPIRTGGSIPIVASFEQSLGAPVLLLGFGLETDRLHSPNEQFDIPNFYQGIRAVARLLDRVGALAAEKR